MQGSWSECSLSPVAPTPVCGFSRTASNESRARQAAGCFDLTVPCARCPVGAQHAAPLPGINREKRSRINRRTLELSQPAYETYRSQMITCGAKTALISVRGSLPRQCTMCTLLG
ncbi:hypothetical protein ACCAA_270055 [Candidatus Accumulibacter aalborgensis]|uniref:Uncharacterized protein n=1 Tax=Candidatus Accumulibacter aalborgensis TaxID=1860102 RepID=A0A1A8XKW7_9PROT|nr:hypothetical protein ACCAA_270055 [Candidatus Accumulibacter aalborgensis]